ncbi:hypothetical protein TNIN_393851 [Trichonephila inaurata madagascariensis]|uniref:Uncharacterized protein n=1 Tax=Trichonephila inaurata madagascariensis TaxID=2747483 RepID=A0A8X6Y6Z8_9ARAC|nr:hypothetical protein TNIN_393851 [Trichonephila inaurata madagascariensis]
MAICSSGHLRVPKTKDRLGRHFFWPKCSSGCRGVQQQVPVCKMSMVNVKANCLDPALRRVEGISSSVGFNNCSEADDKI